MSTPIRRAVFDELTATVRAMLANEASERVLFLTGEAGIGKTTLLNQLVLALEADAKPPITAMAECSTPVAGSGVGFVEALKPFADVMSALVEAGAGGAKEGAAPGTHGAKRRAGFKLDIGKFFVDTAPSWIGLIPVIGGPIFHALNIVGSGYDQVYLHNKLRAESASSASNQEQVFRQYINFLGKLSTEVPVLIILDDFHWADTSSTNLLFAAARDLSESPVVFLVVYREDDIHRSANAEQHPLQRIRDEIERYSMSKAIEVPHADQHDLHMLMQMHYADYVTNDELEKWLLRITDGNLLFATQFLSTLQHDNFLEAGTGLLLKDLATVSVPSSARAVVAGYLHRLNDEDKEQLRYASVEGETVTAQMAARFLELSLLKVLPRLRLFTDRYHILRPLGSQTPYATETTAYQFVHYLVHKALYVELAKEERVILHGIACDILVEELAAAETAQHNVHGVASRLAAHATMAGRHEVAASALLKGAEWVWKSFAADEALYLLDRCQSAAQAAPVATPSLQSAVLRALLLRVKIHMHAARYPEAERICNTILTYDLITKGIITTEYIHARLALASIRMYANEMPEALVAANESLKLAEEGNIVEGRVNALRMLGILHMVLEDFDKAIRCCQSSLELALQSGDLYGQAAALSTLGNVEARRGRDTVSRQFHEEALVIHRETNDAAGITLNLNCIGNALEQDGDVNGAIEKFEAALAMALSTGARRAEAVILNNLASAHVHRKAYHIARELAQRSLVIKEEIGDQKGVMYATGVLAKIQMQTGEFDEAHASLTRSLAISIEQNDRLRIGTAHVYFGWLAIFQGHIADALPKFQQAHELFIELGIADNQMDGALGVALCQLRLEISNPTNPIVVTAAELAVRTRKLLPDVPFEIEAFNSTLREFRFEIAAFGITIEA